MIGAQDSPGRTVTLGIGHLAFGACNGAPYICCIPINTTGNVGPMGGHSDILIICESKGR